MTLSTAGYTVATNQPLNHARILYAPITGTITAGGTNGALAANDYTAQRWTLGTAASNWTLVTAATAQVDTVFISAHNLKGATVAVQVASTVGGAFTTIATVSPTDNSTIAVMVNNIGVPYSIRELRLAITGAVGTETVGIIRAGVGLQMTQPFYGGFAPTRLNRVTEGQQTFSETGQWLGRTQKRRALTGQYEWTHLKADWYRSTFEPFAQTLPLYPFGIIGNPAQISDDVVWAWTQSDVKPSNMGVRDYMQVGFGVVGYYG